MMFGPARLIDFAGAEEQARAYRTADRDELHVAIAQATFHLVVFVERLERGVHFLFVRVS